MTTATLPFDVPERSHAADYLHAESGVWSWLNTRDHKRIALMFLGAVNLSLLLGGLFAMLLRVELLTPERTVMSASAYNRMFTLHGIVMVFFFLIPAIPAALGNFILPIMLQSVSPEPNRYT